MIREVNATDGMDMLVITGKNNYQRNDANTVEPLSRGAVVWLAAVVAKTDAKNKNTTSRGYSECVGNLPS